MRNYVLGNSEDVFLRSYQPHRVSHNLVEIAFGQHAAGSDADLFKKLRHSLLQRDPNAPIYVSEQDMQALEEREDIRDLRCVYRNTVAQSSSDNPSAKKIAAKIFWIRRTLSEARLLELRRSYFEEVDRLRAMGETPTRAADHGLNPGKTFDPKGAAAAESIGEFLQLERLEKSESESVTLDLVSLYVPLLQRRPAEVIALLDLHGSEQKDEMMPPYEPPIDPKRPHRCLFGCDSFSKRGNLTKHNTTCHFNRGDFDQPFSCPECRRLRLGEHVIDGPMQWSNHIETCHGREHAPNLPRGLYSRPSASWMKNMPCHQVSLGQEGYCLVCGDRFKNAGAFATHFRIQHVEKQKFFESPFDCPECVRQQTDPSRFDNAIDWQAHLKMDHQGGGIYGKLHILLPPRGKKRLRTEPSNCQDGDELATVRTPRQRLMLTKEDDTSAPAPIIHSPAYTLSRFSPGVDFSLIDPQLLENC